MENKSERGQSGGELDPRARNVQTEHFGLCSSTVATIARPKGSMKTPSNSGQPDDTVPRQFLSRALSLLRWVTTAGMLAVTLVWPVSGLHGIPISALLCGFAVYNLAVDLLRLRVTRLRSFVWVSFVDLPVISLIYYLDHDPGGPTFVLFYLAIVCAASSLSLTGTLLYTAAVVAVVGVVAPTLPLWVPTSQNLRDLSARLIVMAIIGLGGNILARRLILEHETSSAVRDEALRLGELEKVRKDFISTISHELRTPITATRVSLGMLQASAHARLRPDEAQLLGNARRETERLNMQIDDLLALNQIEAGALELDLEIVDLRLIVADAAAALHPLLEDKRQTLEIDLPVPLPVTGDTRRLEQVAENLLANAYWHTPPGTRVAVSGRAADGEVRLAVSDDGPGIDATQLNAIFDRFHRGSVHSHGSGLGLAIAQAIVERHAGRIWAESRPGQGSTFHVCLPMAGKGTKQ